MFSAGLILAVLPGAAQAGRARDLVVANHGTRPVVELHVSSSQTDDWGEDRLGGEALKPGASVRVRLGHGADCHFDIIVSYPDGRQEEADNFNVCQAGARGRRVLAFNGSTAQDPAAAEQGEAHRVTVTDHTPLDITEVYVSPASAAQWGDDRLPDPGLPAGGVTTLTVHGGCQVDLRVVFENKAAEERRDLNICARPAVTIAPGWTTQEGPPDGTSTDTGPGTASPTGAVLPLTLRNATLHAIAELYAYPDDAATHGADLLSGRTAPQGGSVRLDIPAAGTCRFTLRAVLAGHEPDLVRTGVDLCTTHEVSFPAESRDARNIP